MTNINSEYETDQSDTLVLGQYAEQAYLEYAMSVVKGRALPDVTDGQKPVQRRILYAMKDMGLIHGVKPVKSARVVGEILGKYHPHGDSSAYEAMVRMAQNFTLRYPLIDGIGNFGSRDGDSAAAMRYTEARLTPIAELLLEEIDSGTVDFVPNYDGAFQEPTLLPARLPMLLLNGASGIAVGMATEIQPHNLTEVSLAVIALLKNPHLNVSELMKYIPGPDFPGGGQIISSNEDILNIYQTGKGSIRVRARYSVEKLTRGQWRIIVHELPPNTSAQKILAQIEEQTNPKLKSGKKTLTQEQQNIKALMLSLLDKVRDESDNQEPVRLVFEPKSSRTHPDEFMNTLMAQTDLEVNTSMNLVMIGRNHRPAQKNLVEILSEWLSFRVDIVTRRLNYRLSQVEKRIHILEGRMIAYLHIDDVIKVIRESEQPKLELIQAFQLTEIQAEDILEIRLRQLAKLEWIKLETELGHLQKEKQELENLLHHDEAKKKLIIKEIQADSQKYGDDRRTLIQSAEKANLIQTTADEPITIILSKKGWLRSRSGHHLDLEQLTFKEGDELLQIIEGRTIWPVVLMDDRGRTYTINAAEIPGGRGDGIPINSLIELQNSSKIIALMTHLAQQHYLLCCNNGYGFITRFSDMLSRVKAGKHMITTETGESVLVPLPLPQDALEENSTYHIILATSEPRLLAFPINEIKYLSRGKGLQLINITAPYTLNHLMLSKQNNYKIHTQGSRGALYTENVHIVDIINKRGRKGKLLKISGKLVSIST